MNKYFDSSISVPVNTLECPFCHESPILVKTPLWKGSHGYHGEFEYHLECKNKRCKMAVKTKYCPNTIYDKTEEECVKEVVDDWGFKKIEENEDEE